MNAIPQALPLTADAGIPLGPRVDLASLRPGDGATVVGFEESAADAIAKLLALGVVPGIRLVLESLGPAVVFRMGHARFAIDLELASVVRVQLQSEER